MKKALLITLGMAAGIAAKAQIPQPDPDTTAKHFLIVASIGNLQEVSAGQLAAQMGKMPEVRSFGQMMVKDHEQGEQELLKTAKASGISLPAAATGGIQPDLALKKAGAHFDALYVHAMVTSHNNTVQTFENYAVNGKNPQVKTFAQQLLPTLKHHVMEIQALDEKMKKAK